MGGDRFIENESRDANIMFGRIFNIVSLISFPIAIRKGFRFVYIFVFFFQWRPLSSNEIFLIDISDTTFSERTMLFSYHGIPFRSVHNAERKYRNAENDSQDRNDPGNSFDFRRFAFLVTRFRRNRCSWKRGKKEAVALTTVFPEVRGLSKLVE